MSDEIKKQLDTFKKIVLIYKGKLTELHVEPEEFAEEKTAQSSHAAFAHCYFLLEKIEIILKKDNVEKARHWIGFIQGILWIEGIYNIKQLKAHGE